MKYLIAIILSLAILSACSSTKEATKNEFPDYKTTSSGLQYKDIEVGTGTMPEKGQICVVHYHGTLLDGTVFDSSKERGQPFEFPIGVGRVIKGWDEGVMTMRIGGKRKLVVPPDLGYGSRTMGSIPPNSTLVFEVELLNIKTK